MSQDVLPRSHNGHLVSPEQLARLPKTLRAAYEREVVELYLTAWFGEQGIELTGQVWEAAVRETITSALLQGGMVEKALAAGIITAAEKDVLEQMRHETSSDIT
jgi:hypothetical protein